MERWHVTDKLHQRIAVLLREKKRKEKKIKEKKNKDTGQKGKRKCAMSERSSRALRPFITLRETRASHVKRDPSSGPTCIAKDIPPLLERRSS